MVLADPLWKGPSTPEGHDPQVENHCSKQNNEGNSEGEKSVEFYIEKQT